ncbi:MAG: hypothetical protein IPO15_17545 [Anaerolineae bacterium]|nr:hypothetical protein [Anaerolineae bacterium]
MRVTMLLERRALTQPKAAPPASRGKIITVCGPKGGIGRTFTATNLALALTKTVSRKIMLLDGNRQLGDIDLAQPAPDPNVGGDRGTRGSARRAELVRTVMATHSAGVDVRFWRLPIWPTTAGATGRSPQGCQCAVGHV